MHKNYANDELVGISEMRIYTGILYISVTNELTLNFTEDDRERQNVGRVSSDLQV